ncbi:MAG: dihydrodipicolinate synthase family protein [Ruminococcaceae bacterium]|nr:dihydrodipicolinate synthase family protein [Oscillospiraceae bacterium]
MIKDIPNGVYPTMITPYTADNKIDYNAVEKLINWYDEKGVAGIFAICQSSEIFFLSFEERLELLKFIVKNAPKNMTIVASGHTADDLDTQIKEANQFIDVGIDGYVFISNRLAKADEDDSVFLKNMEYVVNNIPEIGLGIYECPYPYKRLMSPAVLKELSQTGKFRFLKDTSCNLDEIKAKLDAVKGTDFKIYNANSATFLESMQIGCAGFSGVMANFHPEFYVWLCENFDKDPELAQKVQDFVGFFSVAECQMYPVNAKYYQNLEGNKMEYISRARDAGEFKRNRQLEIEQMYNLTQHFKKLYNI